MTALVDEIWAYDEGLVHAAQAGLSREPNLVRRVGSTTVTLVRTYVDATRAAIAYTVEGQSGTIQSAVTLPGSPAVHLRPMRGFGSGLRDGVQAHVQVYDTHGLIGDVPEVTLHFTAGEPTLFPGDASAQDSIATIALTLPVPPRRTATPQQRIAGVVVQPHGEPPTVTDLVLEQVVVTPAEARVYLRGASLVAPSFTVAGQEIAATGGTWESDSGAKACSFPSPVFYHDHGAWTLAVQTRWESSSAGWRLAGQPTVFSVTVP